MALEKNWFIKYLLRNSAPVMYLFPKSSKQRQLFEAYLSNQVDVTNEQATIEGKKLWLKYSVVGFIVTFFILFGIITLIIKTFKKWQN